MARNRTSSYWEQLLPAGANNYYIRSLLGEHMFVEPVVEVTSRHIEAAKSQVLQYDMLLILDNRRSLDVSLRKGLGWHVPFPKSRSRSSATRSDFAALPTDFERLQQRNQPDVEVYQLGERLALLDLLLFQYANSFAGQSSMGGPQSMCGYVGGKDDTRRKDARAVEVTRR